MGNKDIKSRIGYFIEKKTAVILTMLIGNIKVKESTIFIDRDLRLLVEKETKEYFDSKIKVFEKTEKDYLTIVDRAVNQADALAKQIFDDLVCQYGDLSKYQFNVVLTGESSKFESASDLIVEIYNKGKKIDELKCSLKAYKSWDINLVNATLPSMFKKILYPQVEGSGKKYIQNLLERKEATKYVLDNFKSAYDTSLKYKEIKKVEKSKGGDFAVNASTVATAFMNTKSMNGRSPYEIISDFMVTAFNEEYKVRREAINSNFLDIIELDNDLHIYIAIQDKITVPVKVLSSKVSKSFHDLILKLKNDLFIHAEKSDSGNLFRFVISDSKGDNIITFNVPIKEEGKFNLWMNFKPYYENCDRS